MPREIKLDCFNFKIKKELQKEQISFSEFFQTFNSSTSKLTLQNQYNAFYADLLNYFGSEFRINDSETKGITISSEDKYKIESELNFVSGILSGGDTGIGKKIHERNNPINGSPVDHFKIHSIPHFFQIWMPLDLNFCIVIIQSYTGESLSSMFLNQLENYFKSKGIVTYNRQKFLPIKLINDFKNNAVVKSVKVKSSVISRPTRQALNPVLIEKEKLHVELTFKGFGKDSTWNQLKDWLTSENQGFLGIKLSEINLDTPVDRIVEYTYRGRTTSGKLTNDYQIIPSLVISDEIKLNKDFHPEFNSIHSYVSKFMNDLIIESGYTK